MKTESANRIVDAYFEVFDQLSLKSFNQGISLVMKNLEDNLRMLKPIRSREGFLARLSQEPEPEPWELQAQVEMIHLLPYSIRKKMPDAMRELVKAFPKDQGGRPRALTNKESKYVCEEIGKLIVQGVRPFDAQNRLAQRMSSKKSKYVSPRTIQRAWRDRAKLFTLADEPSTVVNQDPIPTIGRDTTSLDK